MRRLFTFGCSYTSFCWPTWSDFVGLDYDEYYNYAQSGGGNRFIFERLLEADVSHTFTEDDTILIMWSTYHRHDLYKDGGWKTPGNVLTADHLYGDEYVEKYFDILGSVLHSLNYIYGAQQLLRDKTEWHMTSMADLTIPLGELNDDVAAIFHRFTNRSIFTEYPGLGKYDFIFEHDNWLNVPLGVFTKKNYKHKDYLEVIHVPGMLPQVDFHPSPYMHLAWCKKVGLEVNEDKVDNLLTKWENDWAYKAIPREEGYDWCRENIPNMTRQ